MRASLETQLRRVDEAAAEARAERAPPSEHLLQEHLLRYQQEADEKARQHIESEVRRLREAEVGRIRAEERARARAEVEKVLVEQQGWQAKQVAALRRREVEASEALRKRDAGSSRATSIAPWSCRSFEVVRVVGAPERGRAGRRRPRPATRVAARSSMSATVASSAQRERAVELGAQQAELAAAERAGTPGSSTRLLQLGRKEATSEQLTLPAERDRNATALARATLAREQLQTAQEALRAKDEELRRQPERRPG